MTLASELELEELVGRKVRAVVEFSGIPEGTVGLVDEVYGDRGSRHRGVMVRWTTTAGHEVRDGFGRDPDFDETRSLEVVP